MEKKKKILIPMDYYLPGFRAGGPIRSISNLIHHLGQDFIFFIITRDSDSNKKRFKQIEPNKWIKVSNTWIYYITNSLKSMIQYWRILKEKKNDFIYLNSFFSPKFSQFILQLNYLNLITPKKILIAPRGEFSPGALQIKKNQKKYFLQIFKRLVLKKKNIFWHFTNSKEGIYVKQHFNTKIPNFIIPNLPSLPIVSGFPIKTIKKPQILRIVYISRIDRKKNLLWAIKNLPQFHGKIIFDIYGPISDKSYWNHCKMEILNKIQSQNQLKINYKGVLSPSEVFNVYNQYHLFILPTLGENYGHAIIESILCLTPVLISDKTPWRNLEQTGIGWDISLDKPAKFQEIINNLIQMDNNEYLTIINNLKIYVHTLQKNIEKTVKSYGQMFQKIA